MQRHKHGSREDGHGQGCGREGFGARGLRGRLGLGADADDGLHFDEVIVPLNSEAFATSDAVVLSPPHVNSYERAVDTNRSAMGKPSISFEHPSETSPLSDTCSRLQVGRVGQTH